MLQLRGRVLPGVMEMNGYSRLSISLGNEPRPHMRFSFLSRTPRFSGGLKRLQEIIIIIIILSCYQHGYP